METVHAKKPIKPRALGRSRAGSQIDGQSAKGARHRDILETLMGKASDGIIICDRRGFITHLNPAAEAATGWAAGDAVGMALAGVFSVEASDEPGLDGAFERALLVNRCGEDLPIEYHVRPINDADGSDAGSIVMFRDLTRSYAAAIALLVVVAHDVTHTRELAGRLARLALHDALTDLPNRSLLSERLDQALERVRGGDLSVAVLYVDLDRFKTINDSFGHEVGDRLLCAVSQRLLACVQASDTVCRQGGDEFIVLLPDMRHPDEATRCAEKIVAALDKPHAINGLELHLSASVGIATFPEDCTDAQSLIRHADLAMYQAKHSGRNGFQQFKSVMQADASAHQSVEAELRIAIERREFVLFYQPKVNLTSGAIVGVEALIRWQNPRRGRLEPVQFMTVAEESGLIVPIGRMALEEACRQMRTWQDAGIPAIAIAVNVSAVELGARAFVSGVRDLLKDLSLEPRYLEFELTETFMMQDWKSAAEVVREVKSLGVRIALDDFGTGYSSLSYMKRFPVDTLKIDQSFIRDLSADADDANIVSAVVNMGRSLHMCVVAEGVETEAQLGILQDRQCPEAQGYFFCRPMPAGQLTGLLHDRAETPLFADKTGNRQARLQLGR